MDDGQSISMGGLEHDSSKNIFPYRSNKKQKKLTVAPSCALRWLCAAAAPRDALTPLVLGCDFFLGLLSSSRSPAPPTQ